MWQGKAESLKKKVKLKQIIINNKSNLVIQDIFWLKKNLTKKKSSELTQINKIETPYKKIHEATPPKIKYLTADSKDSLLWYTVAAKI